MAYNAKYDINHPNQFSLYTSGSGVARGGGYCKQSASAAYAIADAGFSLSEAIDGRGINAVERALINIGEYLNLKGLKVVHSHA